MLSIKMNDQYIIHQVTDTRADADPKIAFAGCGSTVLDLFGGEKVIHILIGLSTRGRSSQILVAVGYCDDPTIEIYRQETFGSDEDTVNAILARISAEWEQPARRIIP